MNRIEYDKESEVMSVILADKKSVDSDVRGNVVIDYDKKGDIVKVNFYNFNLGLFRHYRQPINDFAKASRTKVRA